MKEKILYKKHAALYDKSIVCMCMCVCEQTVKRRSGGNKVANSGA